VANKGYSDPDNHRDPSDGDHSTCHARPYKPEEFLSVSVPTRLSDQIRNGGYTQQERPQNNTDGPKTPRKAPLTSGTADSGGRYNVAAYPGGSAAG